MRASGQTSRPACKVLSIRDGSLSACPEIRPAAIAIPIAGPPETSSKRLKGQVMMFAFLGPPWTQPFWPPCRLAATL